MTARAVVVLAGLAACARTPTGAPPPVTVALQPVATSLTFPVFLTAPPGDSARLFVVEKGGVIRVFRNDTLLATPYLDISALVSTGSEQGLLGLAFDPGYAANGRFYVSYTDTAGDSQIARYLVSVDPNLAVPTADRILLSVTQPDVNHNGGGIAFGPDGRFYLGLGDGGGGGDPGGHGQDRTELLGSLLRLDLSPVGAYAVPLDNPFVGQSGLRGELWDYGLRNPWRFSFDRRTGDLYIGDVGHNAREEIDVSPAAGGGGRGANYGWSIMEGSICYGQPTCLSTGLTFPVYDYGHTGGACAVTGGYVYRGAAIPPLQGIYFFGDYCGGWVRSFRYAGGQASALTDWSSLAPGGNITSFGEDAAGELYILTAQGGVYRIVP